MTTVMRIIIVLVLVALAIGIGLYVVSSGLEAPQHEISEPIDDSTFPQ